MGGRLKPTAHREDVDQAKEADWLLKTSPGRITPPCYLRVIYQAKVRDDGRIKTCFRQNIYRFFLLRLLEDIFHQNTDVKQKTDFEKEKQTGLPGSGGEGKWLDESFATDSTYRHIAVGRGSGGMFPGKTEASLFSNQVCLEEKLHCEPF